MRKILLAVGAFGALAIAGAAQAAPSLEIRDAVARVTIVPEDRADIDVQIARGHPQLTFTVGHEGERTVIDGHQGPWGTNCVSRGDRGMGARINMSLTTIEPEQMPRIIVRVPRDVDVRVTHGGVQGSIGNSRSLRLAVGGCGEWAAANVEGSVTVANAGSGRVRIGSAAQADLTLAGSGEIMTTDIAGPAEATIAGSGRIVMASAGQAELRISGSGDIDVGAVRGGLEATSAGSGDVTAQRITGPLQARIMGSGNVRVRGGEATLVRASIMGSGDVDFGGRAGDLDVSISGSGDVSIGSVTGHSRQSVRGSGHVTIGS